MQHLSVYLYSNTFDVILDLDNTVKGANQDMYQRDLTIQKGIKNQIRIQFKNSDQKRIRIYNTQTFIFSMFDTINQRMLIEKPLTILDEETTSTKGLALLTLDESDTLNLDRTSYNFTIKMTDGAGSYLPTYSNTYYGMVGTIHLNNEIYPKLQDSIEIKNFNKIYNDSILKYEYNSGNIYANPEYNGSNALHTVAFYLTNYKGTVIVEATLDADPAVNSNYSTITSRTYTGFTGIDYINFNGVFSFIRVKYIPDQGPGDLTNDNPLYYGSFDKLLYRS